MLSDHLPGLAQCPLPQGQRVNTGLSGLALQADHGRTTRAADCGVVRVGSRSADCNTELDWIKQTLNRPCITECSAWVVQNVMLNLVGEKRKGKERKSKFM